MSKTSWLVVTAVLLSACQSQETPEQAQGRMAKETDSLRTVATAFATRWEGWVAAGQGDSIASVFADDGREMPPNAPAMVGHAAIAKFEGQNAAVFAERLAIHSDAFAADGPIGVERGSYTFEGKARPKARKGTPASINEDGKYVIYWRNQNGQWRIEDLIWNSNASTAMPAASKKPAAHSSAKKKKRK
jgi:ketosteroid isomerase-like protein